MAILCVNWRPNLVTLTQ